MTTKTINKYEQFKTARADKFNSFPIFFAFNKEQFEEGKKKIGVTDNAELLDIGCGGFIRKTEKEAFKSHMKLSSQSVKSFLKDKANLLDALIYELNNHEYSYTCDHYSALQELDLNFDTMTPEQKEVLAQAKQLCYRED